MARAGHTLVECITIVLVLSILALVAVPRLHLGAVWGARTDVVIRQLATDLRRTRMQAIARAADKPAGFALVMTGAGPYRSYQIVDLEDSAVVADRDIAADVRCTGGRRFEFGPLGNLKEGSDTQLHVASERRVYQLQITPATGMVKWLLEE